MIGQLKRNKLLPHSIYGLRLTAFGVGAPTGSVTFNLRLPRLIPFLLRDSEFK